MRADTCRRDHGFAFGQTVATPHGKGTIALVGKVYLFIDLARTNRRIRVHPSQVTL